MTGQAVEQEGQAPKRKAPNRGKAGGRAKVYPLRLSDVEAAELDTRAAAAGLTLSGYLRASALGDAGAKARRRPTVEKQLLSTAIAELNRVGNNVNQIARAVNIGLGFDPGLYQAVGDELRQVLAKLLEAVAS